MAKLGAAIDAAQTTIPLLDYIDPSDISASGVVLIESEKVAYTNTTDRELVGCTRGFGGTSAATHAQGLAVTQEFSNVTVDTDNSAVSTTETHSGSGSHQSVAADLTLASAAGDNSDTSFLGAIMGNLFGGTLTKTKNYLGGLIGAYSITGTKATTYPAGAVLGQITDGVTEADGAFVAYIDGDSSLTTARAAYTVMHNNSTPGSGFAVGVDLQGASHDGYSAVSYSTAELRFSNGTKVTVSGDTIVFTNAAGNKSVTLTMV